MRLALVPRTTEFYGLFADAGLNAVHAARLVSQRFTECPQSSVLQSDVKKLENVGDDLTAEIIQLLNTQYITPFDREDIYGLATVIDDVVDNIEHASELLDLYKIEAPMEQALEQCRILVDAAGSLSSALEGLRTLKGLPPHLARVKELEDAGDRVLRDALGALFEDEDVSPRVIIRWKDIFEALEQAIDACETAANLVGNIVVKNA